MIDPIRVYVLWHEAFADGPKYARAIYDAMRGDPGDMNRGGTGIPVYYVRRPAVEKRLDPADLRSGDAWQDAARLNVIVPLVDANMATDAIWKEFLKTRVAPPPDTAIRVVPVAFHKAAYDLYGDLNLIRMNRDGTAAPAEAVCRQLTEYLCRLMCDERRRIMELVRQGKDVSHLPIDYAAYEDAGLPIKLFVSYSSGDGLESMSELRESVTANYPKIKVFVDESDLPTGVAFARRLEEAVSETTDAMIVLQSDSYAHRPWCRWELQLARQPRRPFAGADDTSAFFSRLWFQHPVISLSALDCAFTRYPTELGSVPVCRWQAGRVHEVIDGIMHEILMTEYHFMKAAFAAHAHQDEPGTHYSNGIPDPIHLLQMQASVGRNGDGVPIRTVCCPGIGFQHVDRQYVEQMTGIELRTLEEMS